MYICLVTVPIHFYDENMFGLVDLQAFYKVGRHAFPQCPPPSYDSRCISDPTTGRVNVISSFQGRLTNKYIVSRLDSIDFDSKEILKNIGLEDRFPKTNVVNNKSSDMEIEEYFSQLDKETLDKLYKVYEMDFVLFNYTIDAFYPLVKNKTENIRSN